MGILLWAANLVYQKVLSLIITIMATLMTNMMIMITVIIIMTMMMINMRVLIIESSLSLRLKSKGPATLGDDSSGLSWNSLPSLQVAPPYFDSDF